MATMSSTSSPTVSRRWLALEMRRLREERRLPQARVAKALGCQVPKVSLMETGQRPLQDDDLLKLLDLFEVPGGERSQYLEELKNARKRGWWEDGKNEQTALPDFGRFVGLEQGAERLRAYQPALFHGLLQTPDYARALFRESTAELSEERIQRFVDLRQLRQEVLRRTVDPLTLLVVLGEAALRHVVGGVDVMCVQLEHVVNLCHARKNISVQVIPFDRGGAYEAGHGAFTVLTFPFSTDSGVVYMEHRANSVYLESFEDIDNYSLLFQRLSEMALTPAESLELVLACAKEYGGRR
jgi:transcriptional regulator with XRE-family HTH domain